jgi:hypothetical protein
MANPGHRFLALPRRQFVVFITEHRFEFFDARLD